MISTRRDVGHGVGSRTRRYKADGDYGGYGVDAARLHETANSITRWTNRAIRVR
jgi:hypothetical protein